MTIKKKIIIGTSISLAALISVGAMCSVFLLTKGNDKNVNKNNINKINGNDEINKEKPSIIYDENNGNDEKIKEEEGDKEPEKPVELVEVDWKTVFPQISSSDYYDLLNYKDGQAWIDEDMISNIIKDVLNRMLVLDGEVKYNYKIIDDQQVVISFKWNNKTQKSGVTYQISTNKI